MNMTFDKPTLVTITAPTCSGKSYLLDLMTKEPANPCAAIGWKQLFSRIVSTTTRPARSGEVDGVDYHFISRERSLEMEQAGEFAELIEFNGTRYGVTKAEMEVKMRGKLAPIVILEPQGLEAYEKLCQEHGWEIFKIYVHALEEVRISRLNQRTAIDVRNAMLDVVAESTGFDVWLVDALGAAEKIIEAHTKRLLSITGDEKRWQSVSRWDAIIPGDDAVKAIKDIEGAIKWRNYRNGQLNT